MEEVRRAFPKINFSKFKFVPNLKRVPLEVAENTAACVIDAFTQYIKWYKAVKRISEVSMELEIELDNMKLMEAQNEKMIRKLKLEVDAEKEAREEDELRAEGRAEKIEDNRVNLRGELEVANHSNHLLSEEIKILKA